MKSIVTNLGSSVTADIFKDKMQKFVLLGSRSDNDTTLIDILENNNITDNNINNQSNISNYIITQSTDIDTSMITNDKTLVITLNLQPGFIDPVYYVYAIALTDESGEIYAITIFGENFNSISEAGEIITIRFKLTGTDISGNEFSTVSDEAYITRREFIEWANNHNHDKEYVTIRKLNDVVNELDQIKENKGTIGRLEDIKSLNNSNIVNVLNEIIENLGDINSLDVTTRDSIVSAINKIYSIIGDPKKLTKYDNIIESLEEIRQIVENSSGGVFADGVKVEDVNWGDKTDLTYVGDINLYRGNEKGSIVDSLNEIYDETIGNNNKIHKISQISTNTNYKIFDKSQDYSGLMKITTFKNSLINSYFEVEINTTPETVKIQNVNIKDELLDVGIIDRNVSINNYIYGLSIVYNDRCLYLSVFSNEDKDGNILYDKIYIDYIKMNATSNLVEEPFSSEGSIAIREGAGNVIINPYLEISHPISANKKYKLFDKNNSNKRKGSLTFYNRQTVHLSFDIEYVNGILNICNINCYKNMNNINKLPYLYGLILIEDNNSVYLETINNYYTNVVIKNLYEEASDIISEYTYSIGATKYTPIIENSKNKKLIINSPSYGRISLFDYSYYKKLVGSMDVFFLYNGKPMISTRIVFNKDTCYIVESETNSFPYYFGLEDSITSISYKTNYGFYFTYNSNGFNINIITNKSNNGEIYANSILISHTDLNFTPYINIFSNTYSGNIIEIEKNDKIDFNELNGSKNLYLESSTNFKLLKSKTLFNTINDDYTEDRNKYIDIYTDSKKSGNFPTSFSDNSYVINFINRNSISTSILNGSLFHIDDYLKLVNNIDSNEDAFRKELIDTNFYLNNMVERISNITPGNYSIIKRSGYMYISGNGIETSLNNSYIYAVIRDDRLKSIYKNQCFVCINNYLYNTNDEIDLKQISTIADKSFFTLNYSSVYKRFISTFDIEIPNNCYLAKIYIRNLNYYGGDYSYLDCINRNNFRQDYQNNNPIIESASNQLKYSFYYHGLDNLNSSRFIMSLNDFIKFSVIVTNNPNIKGKRVLRNISDVKNYINIISPTPSASFTNGDFFIGFKNGRVQIGSDQNINRDLGAGWGFVITTDINDNIIPEKSFVWMYNSFDNISVSSEENYINKFNSIRFHINKSEHLLYRSFKLEAGEKINVYGLGYGSPISANINNRNYMLSRLANKEEIESTYSNIDTKVPYNIENKLIENRIINGFNSITNLTLSISIEDFAKWIKFVETNSLYGARIYENYNDVYKNLLDNKDTCINGMTANLGDGDYKSSYFWNRSRNNKRVKLVLSSNGRKVLNISGSSVSDLTSKCIFLVIFDINGNIDVNRSIVLLTNNNSSYTTSNSELQNIRSYYPTYTEYNYNNSDIIVKEFDLAPGEYMRGFSGDQFYFDLSKFKYYDNIPVYASSKSKLLGVLDSSTYLNYVLSENLTSNSINRTNDNNIKMIRYKDLNKYFRFSFNGSSTVNNNEIIDHIENISTKEKINVNAKMIGVGIYNESVWLYTYRESGNQSYVTYSYNNSNEIASSIIVKDQDGNIDETKSIMILGQRSSNYAYNRVDFKDVDNSITIISGIDGYMSMMSYIPDNYTIHIYTTKYIYANFPMFRYSTINTIYNNLLSRVSKEPKPPRFIMEYEDFIKLLKSNNINSINSKDDMIEFVNNNSYQTYNSSTYQINDNSILVSYNIDGKDYICSNINDENFRISDEEFPIKSIYKSYYSLSDSHSRLIMKNRFSSIKNIKLIGMGYNGSIIIKTDLIDFSMYIDNSDILISDVKYKSDISKTFIKNNGRKYSYGITLVKNDEYIGLSTLKSITINSIEISDPSYLLLEETTFDTNNTFAIRNTSLVNNENMIGDIKLKPNIYGNPYKVADINKGVILDQISILKGNLLTSDLYAKASNIYCLKDSEGNPIEGYKLGCFSFVASLSYMKNKMAAFINDNENESIYLTKYSDIETTMPRSSTGVFDKSVNGNLFSIRRNGIYLNGNIISNAGISTNENYEGFFTIYSGDEIIDGFYFLFNGKFINSYDNRNIVSYKPEVLSSGTEQFKFLRTSTSNNSDIISINLPSNSYSVHFRRRMILNSYTTLSNDNNVSIYPGYIYGRKFSTNLTNKYGFANNSAILTNKDYFIFNDGYIDLEEIKNFNSIYNIDISSYPDNNNILGTDDIKEIENNTAPSKEKVVLSSSGVKSISTLSVYIKVF